MPDQDTSSESLGSSELKKLTDAMPTSILPLDKSALDAESDYAWLDLVPDDDCFMPLDQTNTAPTKSLDFGLGGVTGSVSSWHELLQMTAPDDECGVIFVRGHFPDNSDAILARAQRRNQTGTFGLEMEIDEESEYALERTPAQGMINLRWPYSRFNFVWADPDKHSGLGSFASQSSCSFVKDQTLYQIIRITPDKLLGSEPTSETTSLVTAETPSLCNIKFQVGGSVRFGCYGSSHTNSSTASMLTGSAVNRNIVDESTFAGPVPLFRDEYKVLGPTEGGSEGVLMLVSTNYRRRLEIRVWVNRKQLRLTPQKSAFSDERADGSLKEFVRLFDSHELKLYPARPLNIVATYTLVPLDGTHAKVKNIISDRDALMHLGVTDLSRAASYRLWAAVLGEVLGPKNAESFQLNTIGRSIEEIMGVLAVPVKIRSLEMPVSSSAPESPESSQSNGSSTTTTRVKITDFGVAFIQNIMNKQVVDLESTLWNIRFLMTALHALNDALSFVDPTNGSDERTVRYQRMQDDYRARITHYLQGTLIWTCHIIPAVCLKKENSPQFWISPSDVVSRPHPQVIRKCRPAPPMTDEEELGPRTSQRRHSAEVPRGPQSVKMRLQKWYCAMILWYLIRHHPKLVEDDLEIQNMCWVALQTLGAMNNEDVETGTLLVDDAYRCMLRWYHSHCILKLYDALGTTTIAELNHPDRPIIDVPKQNSFIQHWRGKAEKAIRSFGQGRLSRQCVGHEEANLALFGLEIGVDNSPLKQQGLSVLDYIKILVAKQGNTEKVNSGAPKLKRWEARKVRSAAPRPAPWELSCLGHHLPINLGIPCNKGECMASCKEFLLADWTFIPSWDHSRANTAGLWWDMTTSAIICTQLLSERLEKEQPRAPTVEISSHGQILGREFPGEYAKEQVMRLSTKQDGRFHEKLDKLIEILEQAKPKASDEEEGFSWKKRRPGLLYHADTSVQSLEDTPNVYRLKQTQNVQVRSNIKRFLRRNHLTRNANFSLSDIQKLIPASKLRHFSCIDFSLATVDSDMPELGISFVRGRMDQSWLKDCTYGQVLQKLLGQKQDLWDLYFMNPELDHRCFAKFNGPEKESLKKARREMLEAYGSSLFAVLNDSIVDLGTKYRVLFAKRLSPIILQSMVYIWHPDALDTFENHLGSISQFDDGNTNMSGSETWYTTITLSHWRLQRDIESEISKIEDEIEENEREDREKKETQDDKELKRAGADKERCAEEANGEETGEDIELPSPPFPKTKTDNFPIPPREVSYSSTKGQSLGTRKTSLATIRQLSMSLTMTGDTMGRYWTCSLVCDLMSESMVTGYITEVRDILQMFIHQQYTGRALAFVLLLGYMCENLALECEKFMEQLNGITGMGPMVLLNGLKWHKPEVALKGLKDMLWGLEALRVFDDKLKNALERIDEATKKMRVTCDRANDIRPLDMRREKERVWEEFNKRHGRLKNAHGSIIQRIEQGSRLREGITSVLSVEQNENISMLTWVTIIYLPVSFIATIFSMGHGIIPNEAGWDTFGWLIAAFLVGTILFSLSLEFIIRYIRRTQSAGSAAWAKFQKPRAYDHGSENSILSDKDDWTNQTRDLHALTRLGLAGSLRKRNVERQLDAERGPDEN